MQFNVLLVTNHKKQPRGNLLIRVKFSPQIDFVNKASLYNRKHDKILSKGKKRFQFLKNIMIWGCHNLMMIC